MLKAPANVINTLKIGKAMARRGTVKGKWVHVADFNSTMSGSGQVKSGMLFYNTAFAELGVSVEWLERFATEQ
jgi:hypothetical protein